MIGVNASFNNCMLTSPINKTSQQTVDQAAMSTNPSFSFSGRANRIFLGTLFVTLWFCYVYVHQAYYDRATSYSRLALLHALFVEKSFAIDPYHERTPDKALWQGHYYSDKAPGTTALALPAFGASVALANGLKIGVNSETGWLLTSWLSCAFSIAIVTAAGGVACFQWLARRTGSVPALIATLALFLGAAPYPYATMMYSHAVVVGLISIALWAIDRDRASPPFLTQYGDWIAGIALGFALASEFTAGLAIVGVGVYWAVQRGWHSAVAGLSAAIPPLLLIPLYNFLCFGDPFTLGYSHQATYPQMKHGLFGIQWPNLIVAFKMLFPPSRGLFFWTPFLLLSFWGYAAMGKQRKALFYLVSVVPVVQVLVISGYVWDWPAGWVLGPRYLAPMLPLLTLPAAIATRRYPFAGAYLAWLSVILTGLATLVDATPPAEPDVSNPLLEMYLPALGEGKFGYNLGKLAGLGGHASLCLFLAILLPLIHRLFRMAHKLDNPAVDSRTL